MKKSKTIACLIAFMLGLSLSSCESYVNGVDPLIDQVEDDQLNNQNQIGFLITGLLGRFGSTGDGGNGVSRMIWRVAGYSDEMIHGMFDSAPDHFTFVQDGPADLDFYEGDWDNYHTLRFFADNLVQRVEDLDASGGISDQELKARALWWGNFVGGLMRMYLADHWGAKAQEGNTPGAPITTQEQVNKGEFGAFFSSTELRALAREKFTAALNHDPGDVPNASKVVWSFIARTYLFDGMDAEAKSAAEKGLQQGDEPFTIPHTLRFTNQMWEQSGRNNAVLFNAHPRFAQYVLDDPKEGTVFSELTADDNANGITSRFGRPLEGEEGQPGHRDTVNPRANVANPNERLPLWEKRILRTPYGPINPTTRWVDYKTGTGVTQDIYTDRDQPFSLIDWREMELILAEVAINAGDNSTGLMHINNVRTWHGLDAYTMADMMAYDNPAGGASTTGGAIQAGVSVNNYTGALGLLIEERDKTLWLKGTRIVDQRRFGLWHLPDGKFKNYMPIPRSETNVNPNVPR